VLRLFAGDLRAAVFRFAVLRFLVAAPFLAAVFRFAVFRFLVAAPFLAAVDLRAVDFFAVDLRRVVFLAAVFCSGRHALQASPFPFAHPAPHAVSLVATKRVVQALDADGTVCADPFGLPR
jgi:hypothetical protein